LSVRGACITLSSPPALSLYFEHLEHVHDLLWLYKIEDTATLAAAFLHDVIEDTDATIDDVHRIFGEQVARLVY
jgi:guanosine-3',5'-bis(diphosphate) 3'-pyrophosphohydrolase